MKEGKNLSYRDPSDSRTVFTVRQRVGVSETCRERGGQVMYQVLFYIFKLFLSLSVHSNAMLVFPLLNPLVSSLRQKYNVK